MLFVPTVREAVENLFVATGVGGKTGAVEPECGGGFVVPVVAAVVVGASTIPTVPVAAASVIVCATVAVVVVGPPMVVVVVAAVGAVVVIIVVVSAAVPSAIVSFVWCLAGRLNPPTGNMHLVTGGDIYRNDN